jgi:hypothetical protein
MVLNIAFAVFLLLSTLFMTFLYWLSKGTKQTLAKNLRRFGTTMTLLGWLVLVLRLWHS